MSTPSSQSQPEVRVSPLRARLEHLAAPIVERTMQTPAIPLVVVGVLLVIGVLTRHVIGAIAFGIIALLLVCVLYLGWPRLTPVEKLMRFAVLLLTVAVAVVMAAG